MEKEPKTSNNGNGRQTVDLAALVGAMVDLDVAGTLTAARQLNNHGAAPADILRACEKALDEIGVKYEAGEYFISGLIMAGTIMNRVINMVTPRLVDQLPGDASRGKVLIGTVKGDIHGLGKNIAGTLLRAYGFEVRDLGVDVPIEEFISAVREFQPFIVGLSVLMTTCHPNMADTVDALRRERGGASRPFIFISGAQISIQHMKLFQADYQAGTAFDTVRLCERLTQGQYQ